MTAIPTEPKNQAPNAAPDWREVFARAIFTVEPGIRPWRDAREDCQICADAILAAIAERGYRLHPDHDWRPFQGPEFLFDEPVSRCSRCGMFGPGLANTNFDSCEGPA